MATKKLQNRIDGEIRKEKGGPHLSQPLDTDKSGVKDAG
jgi:hypothetical protein